MVGLTLQAGLGVFGGVGFDGVAGKGKLVGGLFGERALAHRTYLQRLINK